MVWPLWSPTHQDKDKDRPAPTQRVPGAQMGTTQFHLPWVGKPWVTKNVILLGGTGAGPIDLSRVPETRIPAARRVAFTILLCAGLKDDYRQPPAVGQRLAIRSQ